MPETFDVILADFPWRFRVWHNETGSGRSADRHYRTMSEADIAALDFYPLASQNCALFLWVTRPRHRETFDLVDHWNTRCLRKRDRFVYKTEVFTWVKRNKNDERFFFGLGYYTRANTEGCWLFVRGDMPVVAHTVSQVICTPVRAHSQKPDEQYELIERLYPGRRYVELFARTTRPGWASLGNEIDGRDIRDVLAGYRK